MKKVLGKYYRLLDDGSFKFYTTVFLIQQCEEDEMEEMYTPLLTKAEDLKREEVPTKIIQECLEEGSYGYQRELQEEEYEKMLEDSSFTKRDIGGIIN